MPIQYGEFTIINCSEPTVFTNWITWLKGEQRPDKNRKHIFLFEDGEIFEYDDKIPDFNFKFLNSVLYVMPLHFEKSIEDKETRPHIYFNKKSTQEPYDCLSDFNQLFRAYSKYNVRSNVNSDYNGIYYCYKTSFRPEIFGILRIKSNECMPRFQFAYSSEEFTKQEIVYLIHRIFNPA